MCTILLYIVEQFCTSLDILYGVVHDWTYCIHIVWCCAQLDILFGIANGLSRLISWCPFVLQQCWPNAPGARSAVSPVSERSLFGSSCSCQFFFLIYFRTLWIERPVQYQKQKGRDKLPRWVVAGPGRVQAAACQSANWDRPGVSSTRTVGLEVLAPE